jgi:hypothetical protein
VLPGLESLLRRSVGFAQSDDITGGNALICLPSHLIVRPNPNHYGPGGMMNIGRLIQRTNGVCQAGFDTPAIVAKVRHRVESNRALVSGVRSREQTRG